MPAAYNTTERYRELENRLSECRGRINILEEKLLGSPVPLPVAEFDRLLDEYRAEQIRLAHLEQEIAGAADFVVTDHVVQVYGYCRDCAAKRRKGAGAEGKK